MSERIDPELEKIKEAMIKFAEREGIVTLNGSDHTARIWVKDVLKFPGKSDDGRKELEAILRNSELWNKFSELDIFTLSKVVQEKKLPPIVTSMLMQFAKKEKVEKIYLRKKEKEE